MSYRNQASRRCHLAGPAIIETLEMRKLLSAVLSGDELLITGTGKADKHCRDGPANPEFHVTCPHDDLAECSGADGPLPK